MLYQCVSCGGVFDEERAARVQDHVDDMYDRGLVAVEYLICPFCGSDTIEDEYETDIPKEEAEYYG